MKLADAIPILRSACGKPFEELFRGHPDDLATNKGHVGGLLEAYIGIHSGRRLLDFEDGELKTNKALPSGEPRETMAITTLLGSMDTLLNPSPVGFEESNVYRKIQNFVYLPVVKESATAKDWYFVDVVHVQIALHSRVFQLLEEDFDSIKGQFTAQLATGGMLRTANGPNGYLQVRTKDSKPYNAIYSRKYGRFVSDKNRAFYFKKEFLRDIRSGLLL